MSLTQPQKQIPKGMRFRERVFFRLILALPIVLGILLAPDDWLRYVVAVGFFLNFISVELLLAKLRKM
jgi:hypothetical protein